MGVFFPKMYDSLNFWILTVVSHERVGWVGVVYNDLRVRCWDLHLRLSDSLTANESRKTSICPKQKIPRKKENGMHQGITHKSFTLQWKTETKYQTNNLNKKVKRSGIAIDIYDLVFLYWFVVWPHDQACGRLPWGTASRHSYPLGKGNDFVCYLPGFSLSFPSYQHRYFFKQVYHYRTVFFLHRN